MKKFVIFMRRVWTESTGVRGRVALNALIGSTGVALSLLFVWTTKQIVDAASGASPHLAWEYVALLVGCLVLQLAVPAVGRRVEAVSLVRYANALRSRLFTRLMHSRWQGRSAFHTADAINRIENDVASLAQLTCSTIPGIVAVMLQLAGAFLFLAFLSWKLALSVVFIMPLAMLVSKLYIKRTRALTREIRDHEAELQTFLQERLRHRTMVASLMGSERSAAAFGRMQGTLMERVLKRADISIFSRTAVTAGFMTGYTVTFLWSADGLITGAVTFGMMTAFLQLVAQVQRPVVDLAGRVPQFVTSSVAMERVDAMLALPVEESGEATMPTAPLGLMMRDVSYRYPDGDDDVISSMTYDFRPGSITGLAGETGSGKTTLLRLMLGLISPDSGVMAIYGSDGRSVRVSPLTRRGLIYVPQGNSLMSVTVRENLLLGNPDATEAEMREALHAAAADFVLDLPDGLDTLCSEGGGGFSEGQAQRIAIARGLLKPGSLMLLDEPTSALDSATELLFMQRLAARLEATGSTAIIVTHRPATLRYCTAVLDLGAPHTPCQ